MREGDKLSLEKINKPVVFKFSAVFKVLLYLIPTSSTDITARTKPQLAPVPSTLRCFEENSRVIVTLKCH